MAKEIKITPRADGGADVTIPESNGCAVCSGDGYVAFKEPIPAKGRFPEIKGVKALNWCHICSDYHCGKCPLCQ